MNKIQTYKSIKLEFGRIAWYVGKLVSAILGREVTCKTSNDDFDYWAVAAVDNRFSTEDLIQLISFVKGGADMCRKALPPDSNFCRSLDMDLSRELLKHALRMDWEEEFIGCDVLWIMDPQTETVEIPEIGQELIFIDGKTIELSRLMEKDAFLEALFREGGTFTELTRLCEERESEFGDPLYWMYPINDGQFNGVYFVLVKEGVLALSYNVISNQDHEVFEEDSARLCTAGEMACFIHDWNNFSAALKAELGSMLYYLEQKEGVYG